MKCRDLLPKGGDSEVHEAWAELFSREVLGAVVTGTSAGKLVEWCLTLVSTLLGVSSNNLAAVLVHILLWSLTIWAGVWIFVYWHRITEAAQQAAEGAVSD